MLNKTMTSILKNKGYITTAILIDILVLFMLLFIGTSKYEEYKVETYGTDISMTSNGNDTILLQDGLHISLESIYHNDNFIALQIIVKNNTSSSVKVAAGIESIEQYTDLIIPSEQTFGKYITIGDSRASSYDMKIEVYKNDSIYAQGTIHVAQDVDKSTILTNTDVIHYDTDIELYYLGNYDNTCFLKVVNNTEQTKKIVMQNDAMAFESIAPSGTSYIWADGLGTMTITMDTFHITVEDANDITIEKE